MLGLVFSLSTVNSIEASRSGGVFQFQRPFDETDLGWAKSDDEARRLYLLAIDCFKRALVSSID